jgi:hypothetical protein
MTLLGKLSRQEKLNRRHEIMNGFPTVLRVLCYRRILICMEL